jgi:hypothetical protein
VCIKVEDHHSLGEALFPQSRDGDGDIVYGAEASPVCWRRVMETTKGVQDGATVLQRLARSL